MYSGVSSPLTSALALIATLYNFLAEVVDIMTGIRTPAHPTAVLTNDKAALWQDGDWLLIPTC